MSSNLERRPLSEGKEDAIKGLADEGREAEQGDVEKVNEEGKDSESVGMVKIKPPYYAVIFSSVRKTRSEKEEEAYSETSSLIQSLAEGQQGYLGIESVSRQRTSLVDPDHPTTAAAGAGQDFPQTITISYWKDLESIKRWKAESRHLEAQRRGKADWYRGYRVRVAKVEREYGFGF
ncbi:hypothetical protein IE53DRAFT_384911 [Violaceomyces palustris]|uniref:Uncharacterized protein n=1 Tax=Violaceomyces palustris TaxID=1673888 RepID=A0ACD0P3I0_9BASI|nr:hypothetical protein IE53DRAFT_384911 [Violaceomyces palustris]